MPMPRPLVGLATKHLELAMRARRLADYLGEADRDRLLRYAEGLEAEAARLDAALSQ